MAERGTELHMRNLKALAELLGEIVDGLPRRAAFSDALTPAAKMAIGAVLPHLDATCRAVFESTEQNSPAASPHTQRENPTAKDCLS